MTKRLQVLLADEELVEIKRAARRRRVSVAGWVRDALRSARARDLAPDPAQKLAALDDAVRHSFATSDIDQMLADIERSYSS